MKILIKFLVVFLLIIIFGCEKNDNNVIEGESEHWSVRMASTINGGELIITPLFSSKSIDNIVIDISEDRTIKMDSLPSDIEIIRPMTIDEFEYYQTLEVIEVSMTWNDKKETINLKK